MRRVILCEDFESVANPQCHGKGLIPYCVENTKLRLERRVSLWQNVLPVTEAFRKLYIEYASAQYPPGPWITEDKLQACDVTRSVGSWIAEAILLPTPGMLEGSYTLILDGSPNLEKSAAVFAIVQQDAAWQAALDISYARGSLPEPLHLERRIRLG